MPWRTPPWHPPARWRRNQLIAKARAGVSVSCLEQEMLETFTTRRRGNLLRLRTRTAAVLWSDLVHQPTRDREAQRFRNNSLPD